MARFRKRRYYKRKGRWSANIKTLTNQDINIQQSGSFYATQDLCVNPVQNDATVSQQYTVKNIELSYEIEDTHDSIAANVIESICVYIMFVPQGMTVTETYPNTHPEYIMAYRFLGSPNVNRGYEGGNNTNPNPGRLPSKIKTRMARRLQTGDKVIFLLVGYNNSTSANQLKVNGLVRWWTKAN